MWIREMLPCDLTQAAELEKICFGPCAWSLGSFSDALQDPNALYLAAVEESGTWADGRTGESQAGEILAGYCGIWQSFEDGDVVNVAVRPEARRQGCARALLEELFRRSSRRGISNFTLEVRRSNLPAIRLYQSLGFVVEGIRKNYYDRPREDALIMWKRRT